METRGGYILLLCHLKLAFNCLFKLVRQLVKSAQTGIDPQFVGIDSVHVCQPVSIYGEC